MIKVTRYQPEDEEYSYWVNPYHITVILPKDFGCTLSLNSKENLHLSDTADTIVSMIHEYKLESSNHDNI